MPGCKFIVNGITYEVDTVETEKTLYTSFGDYRPDIIVTATSGKIFYFEIRVTNRKTELYAPKWDELENDIVEVDTRYFINQKYNDSIPTFDLIYSEGKCYIKSYTRKDYDHLIGTRKVEWKRQSKLDYKIQWERLDWFWNALSEYKKDESKKDSVIESFGAMDISDRIWCYQNIKGKSCVDIKQELAENINQYHFDIINNLFSNTPINNITVDFRHVSPLIYEIRFNWKVEYLTYTLYNFQEEKIRLTRGLFVIDKCIIEEKFKEFIDKCKKDKKAIDNIIGLLDLPFIKTIKPQSHYWSSVSPIEDLYFEVIYEDNIHNRYIKEPIGSKIYYSVYAISKRKLNKDYDELREKALKRLDQEIIDSVISSTKELSDFIAANRVIEGTIRIRKSYNKLVYVRGSIDIASCLLEVDEDTKIDKMLDQVKRRYRMCIKKDFIIKNLMNKYVNIMNSCKNEMWYVTKTINPYIYKITLDNSYTQTLRLEKPYSKTSIERQLSAVMNEMASGLYSNVRLLEVDNSIG